MRIKACNVRNIALGLVGVLIIFGCGQPTNETEYVEKPEVRVPLDSLVKDGSKKKYQGISFTGVGYGHYENDTLRIEYRYMAGHANGISRGWYENGQLEWESVFLYPGKLIGTKEWNEDGEVTHISPDYPY